MSNEKFLPDTLVKVQQRFDEMPPVEQIISRGWDDDQRLYTASLIGTAAFDVLEAETGKQPDFYMVNAIEKVLRKNKRNLQVELERIRSANRLNSPVH